MPAKDKFHDAVKNALTKDGWTITHDPFPMKLGGRDLYIDLGAEKLFAAEKDDAKIAVEVKSFIGKSIIADVEQAIGQFILYREVLSDEEPDRNLFLAIEREVFNELQDDTIDLILVNRLKLKLLIFEAKSERIIEWKT